jgi:hypothetical protein
LNLFASQQPPSRPPPRCAFTSPLCARSAAPKPASILSSGCVT